MHTSTSPQYAIIASCDVSAAMMEPPGGTALVESIIEALTFAARCEKVDDEWGRTGGSRLGPGAPLAGGQSATLDPARERWHASAIWPRLQYSRSDQGHRHHAGPRRLRQVREDGHSRRRSSPAIWPSTASSSRRRPLLAHHVHIGITKGRWNTLVTALQQFQDDYDKNQPLRILPEFCAATSERVGLRDLCQQTTNVQGKRCRAGDHRDVPVDMQPALKPSDAYACMAHREIDRVEIDNLEGRVTGVLLTSAGNSVAHSRRALQRTIVEYLGSRGLQREISGLRDGHPRARQDA